MHHSLFCTTCGALLRLQKGEGEVQKGICPKGCGHNGAFELKSTEKVLSPEAIGTGILLEEDKEGFPHTCKKCGYEYCEITDLGAQYADESNVYLYRCKQCNHTERQADGSGNS